MPKRGEGWRPLPSIGSAARANAQLAGDRGRHRILARRSSLLASPASLVSAEDRTSRSVRIVAEVKLRDVLLLVRSDEKRIGVPLAILLVDASALRARLRQSPAQVAHVGEVHTTSTFFHLMGRLSFACGAVGIWIAYCNCYTN